MAIALFIAAIAIVIVVALSGVPVGYAIARWKGAKGDRRAGLIGAGAIGGFAGQNALIIYLAQPIGPDSIQQLGDYWQTLQPVEILWSIAPFVAAFWVATLVGGLAAALLLAAFFDWRDRRARQ